MFPAPLSKSKNKILIFFGLLILFSISRLLPVLTAVERVSHYDELDLGVIAKECLQGPRLPLWHYQMDPYGGESIVLAALAVPFVKLLGATLLAVKIPSLIFALALFFLTFIFLEKFFSLKAAQSGCLLLIFAPPSFLQFSLAGLSGHGESLVFSLAGLYFFYDFLFGSRKKISLFLFGVSSGLGFWFYHENAVMTAACLLAWFLTDRKSFFYFFLLFLAGLTLGLTPWFAYTRYYGAANGLGFAAFNFSYMAENLTALKHGMNKATSLLLDWIPFSFAFFPVLGVHEKLYSAFYFCTAYIPLLAPALKKKLEKKLLPLLLFPPVFFFMFVLSFFSPATDIGYVGYRYLAPLQFFMIFLAVLLSAQIKFQKKYLGVLIILGFLGQTSLMFQEPFGRAQKYNGFSYYRIGTQWFHTLPPKVQNAQDLAQELLKRNSTDSYFLLWGIASVGMGGYDDLLLINTNPPLQLEQARPFLPPSAAPYLDEWAAKLKEPENNFPEVKLNPEALAKTFLRVTWDSNTFFNHPVQNAIKNLAPSDLPDFYRGLGWVVRAIHREDTRRALDWIQTFPPEMKSYGLQGLKGFDERYRIPK